MSRRELFGSLCALVFLVNLARIVFAPLIQPAAADFGVSPGALGVVATAAWVGSAAPRLPTGYLLTRIARHYVVAATGTLLVVTSAFTALSSTVEALAVGAFLMGLSSGMYFIAANPLVSELFPERVGAAIGVHGMSSQFAAVLAPLAVSAVLLVDEWRTTFLLVSAIAAVSTVGFVLAARRTPLPEAGREDRSLLLAARAQWRVIFAGVVFIGAAGFLWNAMFNLYGPYLAAEKGIDVSTGRTLLSLTFAAGVPAFVVTGQLVDRVSNVPLLIAVVVAFAACVVALTLAEGLVAIAAVTVVLGYVVHSLFPAVDTYTLSSLPDRHRGSAYALFSASGMFIQALGSGTVGLLVESGFTYAAVFRGLAAGLVALAALLFVLHRAGRIPAGGAPGTIPG